MIKKLFLITAFLFYASLASAGTYWVHPSGSSAWSAAGCQSVADPGSGKYCSLATANTNAAAGDTVKLKSGTYSSVGVYPSNSGTGPNARITFQAETQYGPYFTGASVNVMYLSGKDYIVLDGVSSAGTGRTVWLQNGSDYNEVKNCDFSYYTVDSFKINNLGGGNVASTNNWIHHNIIRNQGGLYLAAGEVEDGGGIYVGGPYVDNVSNYTTIENNTLYAGGHHVLEIYTNYNVLKNNHFYNYGWMTNGTGVTPHCTADANSKWGNRNIQLYDSFNSTRKNVLVEGNRFGPSGPPPDDMGGDGLTITSPGNIIRYNEIYGGQNNGVYFKRGSSSYSDNNAVFNNTIYSNGRHYNTCNNGVIGWTGYGMYFSHSGSGVVPLGNIVVNNLFWDNNGTIGHQHINSSTQNTFINNFLSTSNPNFTTPDKVTLNSAATPNFALQASSTAVIDGGIHLTTAVGSGSNSTSLTVDKAWFFQDGSWGSSLARGVTNFPDWVCIGTVSNCVQISQGTPSSPQINYSAGTINLASAKSWSSGAYVWLYKDSSGDIVLYNTAPDYGAHEYAGDYTPSENPTTVTGEADRATNTATETVTGTAFDDDGIASVVWTNSRGGSGSCTGEESWSCGSITMYNGSNSILITVTDSLGDVGTDTVTLSYYESVSNNTTVNLTGPQLYYFKATGAGNFKLTASVNAADAGTNSFYVDIDTDPAGSATKQFHIGYPTTGYDPVDVRWGTAINPDAYQSPTEWVLSGANQILYIREREAGTLIESVKFVSMDADETAPAVTIATSSPQSVTSDALTVTGTATDAVWGTGSVCKFRIGAEPDADNGTACTGTTGWSCAATGFSLGANTLYIECGDAVPNWSTGHSITVNYGTPTPLPAVTMRGIGSFGGGTLK